MKPLPKKDLPAVAGGVKPGPDGEPCTAPPTSPFGDYPQFPTTPVQPDVDAGRIP